MAKEFFVNVFRKASPLSKDRALILYAEFLTDLSDFLLIFYLIINNGNSQAILHLIKGIAVLTI